MPHRCRTMLRRRGNGSGMWARSIAAIFLMAMISGCGGAPKAYSWKPQAASQRPRPKPTTRPSEVNSGVAGADVLEESHQAAKVTWVAVPSPDGKKMRWVQVN